MPVNLMDAHYRSFLHDVVPRCLEKSTGVIGMKGLGGGWPDGRFLSDAGLTPEECYRFCLSLPVSVQQDIRIVREFVPMTAAEMDTALGRLKTVAGGDGMNCSNRPSISMDHTIAYSTVLRSPPPYHRACPVLRFFRNLNSPY